MKGQVEKSAEWLYQGIWAVLVSWFRVPKQPPALPASSGSFYRTFHPSRRYLSYLKLYFWVLLLIIDIAILLGWILLVVWQPLIGWILAFPFFLVAVVPDIVAYIAIHLRYDTMWYVMTDRSFRARRGVWLIIEHTITFENVQNVYVRRGPVEQLFGIAKVIIETAGASEGDGQNPFHVGNKTIIEGIDNAEEIRCLILERIRHTKSAGLGDDAEANGPWSQAHLELLRDIRDEVRSGEVRS